jgi:hypothetical protein
MSTDQKLIDDVKNLLRASGYSSITSSVSQSDGTTTVSAQNGNAGAVFHWTPQTRSKTSQAQTVFGGHAPDYNLADIAIAPTFPDLHNLAIKQPVDAAKLLNVTPETLQRITAVQPS